MRLAVLNYFWFSWLKCSEFVLISPTEPCNATEKNVRLSAIKTHYFISFILFLSSSAHRKPLGGVLRKIGSATVLKPIKKYLERSSIFHESSRLLVCNFTKVQLLHRYFSYILNTDAAVYLFFKNVYHLNKKSKENFLNNEVYGVFLLTFILRVF